MKKTIKIFQENLPVIEMYDEDDSNKIDYIMRLQDILKSPEIKILETTSGFAILKPSEIKLILVSDILSEVNDVEICNSVKGVINDENMSSTEDFIGD